MAHPATISRHVFVPVRFLRLRIASGVYDCRRECAFLLRLLPVIKSLVPKDWITDGRTFRSTTTAWPAHTLASPCCLRRLHSVSFLHFRRRLESIIIRSTASSTSVCCQAQKHARSLHCIPLALILTRHVHNPTLYRPAV